MPYVLISEDREVRIDIIREDDCMMNIGKPLILVIGIAAVIVSVALINHPRYERIPNVDGREYVINRWTGRVAVCDASARTVKPR